MPAPTNSILVYSPLQFLGLALFLNLLFVGFYNRSQSSPLEAQSLFLNLDLVIFFLLGVALLRTRERTRTLLRNPHQRHPLWEDAVWPAPVLGLGALLAGALIVARLNYSHATFGNWSLGFAALRSLAFTFWIVSDLQLLQCLSLRPGKHPLAMAVLYLSIYYVWACFILSTFGCFRTPQGMPVGSLFVPSAMFLLEPSTWENGPYLWLTGLTLQAALIFLFFYLQN